MIGTETMIQLIPNKTKLYQASFETLFQPSD